MNTTILLADDHIVLRDGLCAIIEKEPDLQVVGQASAGRQAVELAKQLSPDLVLMDIGMQDLNGVDATRRIVAADPKVRVIALSAYAERQFVLAMLEAGAWGYLVKSAASEELLRAVRAVLANQKYLSPAIAGLVVDSYTKRLFPGERCSFVPAWVGSLLLLRRWPSLLAPLPAPRRLPPAVPRLLPPGLRVPPASVLPRYPSGTSASHRDSTWRSPGSPSSGALP